MDTTKRYPRTLEQAFGPYARGPIQEPEERMPAADRIVVIGSCICGVAIIVMALVGWL